MCPDWESNQQPFGLQPVLNPLRYTSQDPLLKFFKAHDWIRCFPLEDINFFLLHHLQSKHSLARFLLHGTNQRGTIGSIIHSQKTIVSLWLIYYTFCEPLLFSTQTIPWEWLISKVYDSLCKLMFFLFILNFSFFRLQRVLPAHFCTLEFGEHRHIDAFVASSALIISPCSLHLCGLKVLIFLVWPHVSTHIFP